MREQTLAPQVPGLAKEVLEECGENVNLCFQCQKCASGCPMVFAMDFTPSQLMHAIRLGLDEIVMSSKTTWLCSTCQTCTTRCPQGLDIAKALDAVKIIAQRKGIKASEPDILAFYKTMMGSIFGYGRVYELGMIAMLKLRTGHLLKDIGLGIKMFGKGKLKLFPSKLFPIFFDSSEIRKMRKRVEKLEGQRK